jgi:peptidoglycan/LPS O-acetylase OafA/YrhL
MAAESTAPRRLAHLDALRGIAALSVMIYHYTTRYDELWGHRGELLFMFPDGGIGVELFFCISGFVIYMTLGRCRDVWEFAGKRCARLYPAYWFAVLLTFAVVTVYGLEGVEVSAFQALINLTMLNRFVRVDFVDPVYWSLTVELLFYFWVAVFFRYGMLERLHRTALLWLGVSMVPTVLEFVFGGAAIPDILKAILLTKHWTFFLTGMLVYKVTERGAWVWQDPVLIGLSILTLFFAASPRYVGLATLAIGIFMLTVFWAPRVMQTRVPVFFGTISYALYLVHQNIGYVVIQWAYGWDLGPNAAVAIATTIAIAIASAVTFWVEVPGRRALGRFIERVSAR